MAQSNEQVAWNNLKILRKKYDTLLAKYGGEVPAKGPKLKKFAVELSEIVDEHTMASGFLPRRVFPVFPKEEVEEEENATDDTNQADDDTDHSKTDTQETESETKEPESETETDDNPSVFKRTELEGADENA